MINITTCIYALKVFRMFVTTTFTCSRAKSIGKDPTFYIINNYLCKYKYMYIEHIPFYVYFFSFLYHLVGPDLISDTTGKIRNLLNPCEHLGSSLVSINFVFRFFF